jgi:hypothetical protein
MTTGLPQCETTARGDAAPTGAPGEEREFLAVLVKTGWAARLDAAARLSRLSEPGPTPGER